VERRWFAFRAGNTSFRKRLRSRLNAFLPLNAETIAVHTAFLFVYSEIFLIPKEPVFVCLGYQASDYIIV